MYNLAVDIRLRRELGAFENIRELGDLKLLSVCCKHIKALDKHWC